jgi:hypothetical protein
VRDEHTEVMENRQRRLVIRISRDSLSFSTAEGSGVRYEPYTLNSSISMAANLREALHTSELLNEAYESTLVMVDSPTLMVPVNEFEEENSKMLYQHAFTGTEQLVVMHSVLPDLNAVVLFAIQKDLRTVLSDNCKNVRYSAAVAPVWRHLHQRSFIGQHQKIYGYFHDRRMEVFSFVQNRFKFCNSFTVNNHNDMLYFLLGVWKQLGMEAERDELHLVGDITERDAFIEEAQRYVKRVFYINPSGEFNRAPVTQVKGIPYDLITLYLKGR